MHRWASRKTRAKWNQTVQPIMLKVGRQWARIQVVGDGGEEEGGGVFEVVDGDD